MQMRYLFGAMLTVLGVGCASQPTHPHNGAIVTFVFDASADTMRVLVTDAATIAAAERHVSTGVGPKLPAGPIVRGAGVDPRFPFHFVPGEVRLADLAMEICDGRPMRTPAQVDSFFQGAAGDRNAARAPWCPWGARPVSVVRLS